MPILTPGPRLISAYNVQLPCATKEQYKVRLVDIRLSFIIGPRRERTCLRGFPIKRDSNKSPQIQRLARKLKFHV